MRRAGILLHPTCLPSRFGIGDLGEEAYRFVNFLEDSGQHLWQVLPLGPTGYGDSPYQCFSAFAGNPLLVSPQKLVADGFLEESDLKPLPKFPSSHVDFGPVIDYKNGLIKRAFDSFRKNTNTMLQADFLNFCNQAERWLEDYALFRAIKDSQGGVSWDNWPKELKNREPKALKKAKEELYEQIDSHKFMQYLFFKQWFDLRAYCHQKQVKIIGDIPIFVAYDSADVWRQPDQFKLDKNGDPTVVAGVPPDYFSATGQLWGNPIYDWDRMKEDGFKWWIERVKSALEISDFVRIDHFRGLAACWEIPFGNDTAKNGRWVKVPGHELLTALSEAFTDLPIFAEDLGVITPDVIELRDGFKLPGVRIIQQAFRAETDDDLPANFLPHNYVRNTVAYTCTHDNDTAVGWFNSKVGVGSTRIAEDIERERNYCLEYLNSNGKEIHWDFIRAVYASVANTVIVPLQDVLGLDSSARMNLPASQSGNWGWRFESKQLTEKHSDRLRRFTEIYGRL